MVCALNLKKVKKRSNEGKKDYYERRKNDFTKIIARPLYYKGLKVYFNKYDKGIDECYEKFVVGSERFHSTKKPDFRRVERLEWIYEIIEKINECGACQEYREGKNKNRNLIYCVEKQFLIVLKKNANCYIIITAYCVSNDSNQQNKYKNMHF